MNPYRFFLLIVILCLTACSAPTSEPNVMIPVTLLADGQQTSYELLPGTTVQQILDRAGIVLNPLDRVTPPVTTPITATITIRVVRIRETFEMKENVIPFEQQKILNENLPEGQITLIQPGVNGLQQVTYRRVYEDNQEVSNTVFKSVIVTEPRPEIVMVGIQKPFTPISIPGKLAYLVGGNAWYMEKTSGNRRPLVTTGDLDGRVFSLSQDGNWLLYTRKAQADQKDIINTLWMVKIEEDPKPISLRVNNIIHHAAWVPGTSLSITYSTVEPRPTAPGWQANNDLFYATYSTAGILLKRERWIDANSGGIYGWWGTNFAWSPDGKSLAYARPDSIGMVDLAKGDFLPLVQLLPYQPRGDWAWVPGISWAPNRSALYSVNHVPKPGLENDETSPTFSLLATVLPSGPGVLMVPQSGMFTYPTASTAFKNGKFLVAYLQSVFPEQSETSRYRVMIMDRDGSNRRSIFPVEGMQGVEPQRLVWGPIESDTTNWLSFLHQGNLWVWNSKSNQAQQITGDGLTSRVDWK
ncbi:MAG TPA: G5 domain-containing protein [Anaerolineaceae bacterium]